MAASQSKTAAKKKQSTKRQRRTQDIKSLKGDLNPHVVPENFEVFSYIKGSKQKSVEARK